MKKMTKAMLMTALILGSVQWGGIAVHAEELHEFTLDPMVVTAQRMETRDLLTPALVEVYDEKRIEKTGAANAFEVLQNTAGINIQSQGFSGTAMGTMTSELMIRGVENGTLILVNGITMNMDGKYNLEDIPSDAIERIEVVKGGGSVLYGSEATGGVVNIITKSAVQNSLKVQVGNFGKERYSLNLGADKFTVFANLENRGFAEEMSSPAKGKTTSYDYGGGESKSVYWNYRFNDKMTFTHDYSTNEHEYLQVNSSYNGAVTQKNNYDNTNNKMALNFVDNGWNAKLAYGIQEKEYFQTKFDGASGEITEAYMYSTRKGHNTEFDIQKNFEVNKDRIILGFNFKNEDMDAYSGKDDIDSTYKRQVYSLYGSYNRKFNQETDMFINLRQTWAVDIDGEQTDLSTGGVTETHNDNMHKFTPEIEFVHKLTEDSSLYAKAGKSFRLPNLTQIFGSGVINPAVNLKPEQGTHYEIGYKLNDDKNAWRLAVFNYKVKDSIEADPKYKGDGTIDYVDYYNSDAKNTGVELSLDMTHDDQWSSNWGIMYGNPKLKNHHTYTDYEWHDAYNKWQLTGGINYSSEKLDASLNANFTGKRTSTDASARKKRNQLFTDLHISYTPMINHKFFIHLNNLFDRKDVVNNGASDYYTLGRNFMLGYEYSF